MKKEEKKHDAQFSFSSVLMQRKNNVEGKKKKKKLEYNIRRRDNGCLHTSLTQSLTHRVLNKREGFFIRTSV